MLKYIKLILLFSLIILSCDLNNEKPPIDTGNDTDNDYNLILLPTHAEIINTVEQLGASNIKIIHYEVFVPFLPCQDVPSPFLGDYYYRAVPSDSSFYAVQGNLATTSRIIRLHYEYSGLGSVIASNDVEDAVKSLFTQYGFGETDVNATGTKISANFPLPSFNQIRQAAEQAGISNIQINTYNADNTDVIPLNEGSRLADMPIIIEINYDGQSTSTVTDKVSALFVNFNNVHIGNNETAVIPLPSRREIIQAVAYRAWYRSNSIDEPQVYSTDDVKITTWWELGQTTWGDARDWLDGKPLPDSERQSPDIAAWNASIKIVLQGNGSNTSAVVENARQEITKLFNNRGFSNLDIIVNR